MASIDPACLDAALARAQADLAALDGSALFLTGGTGFFGRWLLALLGHARAHLGVDCAVTVLSRDPAAFAAAHPDLAAQPALRLVPGDVRTFDPPPGRFTHVIHAAADTSAAAERDRMGLIGAITGGTARVLAHAAAAGAGRFLLVGSGAVYGPQPADLARIPESYGGAGDPLDPRSAYGSAKRLAEQICAVANAAGPTPCVVARCFAFVGPGLPLDGHFAIGNFIRDAIAGRPIVVSGDGTPLRSYLYAGDLAVWLLALLRRGRPGTAYNVGSDRAIAIGDLARRVSELIPGSGPVTVLGRPDAGAPRQRYVPAIDRARDELGLDAWTALDAAILRTAEAARRTGSAQVPASRTR